MYGNMIGHAGDLRHSQESNGEVTQLLLGILLPEENRIGEQIERKDHFSRKRLEVGGPL